MPSYVLLGNKLRPAAGVRVQLIPGGTLFEMLSAANDNPIASGQDVQFLTEERFEGASMVVTNDDGTQTAELAGDRVVRSERWVLAAGVPVLDDTRYLAPRGLAQAWHGVGMLLPSNKVVALSPALINSRVYDNEAAFVTAAIGAVAGQLPYLPLPPGPAQLPV